MGRPPPYVGMSGLKTSLRNADGAGQTRAGCQRAVQPVYTCALIVQT
jgi:hypothetical protein